MGSVTVRGVTLYAAGTVTPSRFRILVPVMANDLSNAAQAGQAGDIVELRLDALPELTPAGAAEALRQTRAVLGADKPLLATVRTAREGGLADLSGEEYRRLGLAICRSGAADLLDLEMDAGAQADALCAAAQECGLKTVFSHHEFTRTPATAEMADALVQMAQRGADVAKLAVMPQSPADTARLLEATAQAAARLHGETPLITMSMGETGLVSRICGAAFGCCAGFATAGVSSAPGQPAAAALRAALTQLGGMMG